MLTGGPCKASGLGSDPLPSVHHASATYSRSARWAHTTPAYSLSIHATRLALSFTNVYYKSTDTYPLKINPGEFCSGGGKNQIKEKDEKKERDINWARRWWERDRLADCFALHSVCEREDHPYLFKPGMHHSHLFCVLNVNGKWKVSGLTAVLVRCVRDRISAHQQQRRTRMWIQQGCALKRMTSSSSSSLHLYITLSSPSHPSLVRHSFIIPSVHNYFTTITQSSVLLHPSSVKSWSFLTLTETKKLPEPHNNRHPFIHN